MKLHIKNVCCILIFISTMCMFYPLNAQQKQNEEDTTEEHGSNIFQFMLNAIKRTPEDSAKHATILNTKSETPFLRYGGKIIRNIFVKEYGFERSFSDTSKTIEYFGTNILNALHRNTREWVIRNNLFIKEKTALNPYMVADNERYLRSLDYIQDARILVEKVSGSADSVDLYVITKDLFSITGELYDLSPDILKARVGDVNVAGMGQKIFFTSLIEKNRHNGFGYELMYSKNNIANTFINATFDYSTIHPDLAYALQDETGWFAQLDRPLFSQYSHFAGGLLFGQNESHNNYRLPDSQFFKYRYNTFDAWIGYNLRVQKLLEQNKPDDKVFIALRYLQNNFSDTPIQVGDKYNFRFNDRRAVLASITFFKQNFYKTNYIYGFGTTEDMPYGYNVALTTGWYKQANLSRPYLGINANKYVYTGSAYFFQYFMQAGSFLKDGQWQDASVLAGAGMYSKLFLYRNLKLRQYVNLSYTKQFNRLGLDPLRVDNSFGVRYFRTDSVFGDQRISLYSETFFFLRAKAFGFKFSPFAFGNISLLKPEEQPLSKSNAYYGLGGGVRTRNENLVFGTIELRFAYFPRKINQESFKITLQGNLRFKYNTNYVHAPDIVDVNNDRYHDIY